MMFHRKYMFYYLFFLEFIKHQLKMIDYETNVMMDIGRKSNLKAGITSRIFLRKRLKWIRNYFDATYDLCDATNEIFGWSNAVAICISFSHIVADIFWFYWKILNKYNIDAIGNDLR